MTVKGKLEEDKPKPAKQTPTLVGIVIVFVLAVAVGIWQFYRQRPSVFNLISTDYSVDLIFHFIFSFIIFLSIQSNLKAIIIGNTQLINRKEETIMRKSKMIMIIVGGIFIYLIVSMEIIPNNL